VPSGQVRPRELREPLHEPAGQEPSDILEWYRGSIRSVLASPFWADDSQAADLAVAGLAEYAPDGTAAPPAQPTYTVGGVLGFAVSTIKRQPLMLSAVLPHAGLVQDHL
jgi:hypothetical protein